MQWFHNQVYNFLTSNYVELVELRISPKFNNNWFCCCLQIDEIDHDKIAYKHWHACQMMSIVKNFFSPKI